MKIGVAANHIGVPVHVLRHWDDTGVVVPDRSPNGHRDYNDEDLHRMRVLRACQSVGISLADIRLILDRHQSQRDEVIEKHLTRLRYQQDQLRAATQFLAHVVQCTHDLLTRCELCRGYGGVPVLDGQVGSRQSQPIQ